MPKAQSKRPGVMIVTGGSRGIGAAIAQLAGVRGYSVVVNYSSNAAAAKKVVQNIQSSGGQAVAVQADVSRERDVIKLFESSDKAFGIPGVLVNNAGISAGFSRVDAISEPALSRVFATNVIGAFLCAREAVKRMSTRYGGSGGMIVNISSRAAVGGGGGEWVHYAATKGALDTMTVGLSREVALEGIRVNAVAPGLIKTEMHASAGAPDRTIKMAPQIPVGRAGVPAEVAEAVLWLVSPAASYVTGAILAVSGGR